MSNDKNSNNTSAAGGVGFLGLLALIFITLKLTGVIGWSWMWVLAPLWIPAAIVIAILLIVLVVILVKESTKQVQQKQQAAARASELDAEAAKYGIQRRPGESDLDLKRRIAFFKQSERRAAHENRKN